MRMQEFFNVTILAVLQGVAEFLPISSSGHLVIGQHLLGMNPPGMRLEVFLHVGTLASIFVFYRRPIATILLGLVASDAERRRAAWDASITSWTPSTMDNRAIQASCAAWKSSGCWKKCGNPLKKILG